MSLGWDRDPNTFKPPLGPYVETCEYYPTTVEIEEAGRPGNEGQFQLYSEFEASLGHKRPHEHENKNKNKKAKQSLLRTLNLVT